MALNRTIRSVEMERNFTRMCCESPGPSQLRVLFDEDLEERLFQLAVVRHDLLIPTARFGTPGSRRESIQRALTRQWLPSISTRTVLTCGVRLPYHHRPSRILTQGVVILEGFVSQTQAIDALSNSFLDSVIDQIRVSMIAEANGKSGNDSRPTLDCAKKSFIRIRSDRSAIKSRDDIAPAQLLKFIGI